jgi:hypothetical protein
VYRRLGEYGRLRSPSNHRPPTQLPKGRRRRPCSRSQWAKLTKNLSPPAALVISSSPPITMLVTLCRLEGKHPYVLRYADVDCIVWIYWCLNISSTVSAWQDRTGGCYYNGSEGSMINVTVLRGPKDHQDDSTNLTPRGRLQWSRR